MKINTIKIAFTSLLLGFAIYCNAQDSESSEKLYIGAKLGTNYSNVYDTQGEEFKANAKFGLAFGGFLTIPVSQFFGIQPEFLFSQKGFKGTGKILGLPYEFTRTTSYIDIPILFSLKPIKLISIVAGPQYSYLLRQKDNFVSGATTIEQKQEFENDNIRKNTFCFIGGVDFNIEDFVIGTRLGWDILKNNGDGSSTSPRYKNTWYQLTIGYRI